MLFYVYLFSDHYTSLGLLLSRDLNRSHRLARDNYKANPSEPAFASTYALSRKLLGEPYTGLAALESLPRDELEREPTSLYYAVLLAATGDDERISAAEHIVKRLTPDDFLKEEWALLDPVPPRAQ